MTTNSTSYQRNYMLGYRADKSSDMKKSLGGRCEKCGKKTNLQFHHKKNLCRGRGFDNLCLVSKDFNNLSTTSFKGKYKLLCDKCHQKLNGTQKCKRHLF